MTFIENKDILVWNNFIGEGTNWKQLFLLQAKSIIR